MHYNITIVQHYPTRFRSALGLGCFMMLSFYFSTDNARQALEHPSTRPAGDYKKICKGGYIFDVQNNDVFSLFIFQ